MDFLLIISRTKLINFLTIILIIISNNFQSQKSWIKKIQEPKSCFQNELRDHNRGFFLFIFLQGFN